MMHIRMCKKTNGDGYEAIVKHKRWFRKEWEVTLYWSDTGIVWRNELTGQRPPTTVGSGGIEDILEGRCRLMERRKMTEMEWAQR